MIIRSVDLETVCGVTSTLPRHFCPEFAFAGKSNVGKSSLINTLMNRRSLARVSSEPGKTRTINFYKVNDAWYLTDLPGYGYAKVSAEEKEQWGKLIERYLTTSDRLKAVFLLLDIRHEPSKNDLQMADWINSKGFRPIVILTKADKLSKNEVIRQTEMFKKVLQTGPSDPVIPFSAETKAGRDTVLGLIDQLLRED